MVAIKFLQWSHQNLIEREKEKLSLQITGTYKWEKLLPNGTINNPIDDFDRAYKQKLSLDPYAKYPVNYQLSNRKVEQKQYTILTKLQLDSKGWYRIFLDSQYDKKSEKNSYLNGIV